MSESEDLLARVLQSRAFVYTFSITIVAIAFTHGDLVAIFSSTALAVAVIDMYHLHNPERKSRGQRK